MLMQEAYIKNLNFLQVYLRTLNHNFSVIAISETWANNDSLSPLNIPGYNSTFKNRTSGRGGGVALFVRNCFKFTVRDDLSAFNNVYFESIFIELTNTTLGIVLLVLSIVHLDIVQTCL